MNQLIYRVDSINNILIDLFLGQNDLRSFMHVRGELMAGMHAAGAAVPVVDMLCVRGNLPNIIPSLAMAEAPPPASTSSYTSRNGLLQLECSSSWCPRLAVAFSPDEGANG